MIQLTTVSIDPMHGRGMPAATESGAASIIARFDHSGLALLTGRRQLLKMISMLRTD